MSTSIKLLDAFKATFGGLSDYAAARKIGITQQSISQIRRGDIKFSVETALLMCEIAGIAPEDWILDLYLERAKSDKEKTLIETLKHRMAA